MEAAVHVCSFYSGLFSPVLESQIKFVRRHQSVTVRFVARVAAFQSRATAAKDVHRNQSRQLIEINTPHTGAAAKWHVNSGKVGLPPPQSLKFSLVPPGRCRKLAMVICRGNVRIQPVREGIIKKILHSGQIHLGVHRRLQQIKNVILSRDSLCWYSRVWP